PESVLDTMGPVVKFLALKVAGPKKVPKDAVVKEQMATMIPIGTAIAQSFNVGLAKAFGDIVGSEMEMMGIHLWLAPALNIHRSILCGRNFEYYSEDSLVSGLTAAAMTEGVQAHKGCGVTIKHYAANNAETNRYCNNSQVSERAMREIYLRGYGICVRKSEPKAVMTSYNLLNGTHTSEHRGLIEDILRSEYGFAGIVMTDWVVPMMENPNSTYRNAISPEVAKAGGDLFMPGSKGDYNRLMEALKEGKVTREQLEINGSRVLRMIDVLAKL
ncbi:MAG: glycoside hydrolase family 3 N-terminal domain-containing protein, partial [Lachnospiraceae bacterium]|nr:glycoside hydrolase family 3 N-terminal domain-containing protein [Lachnospiraceae bacterium]